MLPTLLLIGMTGLHAAGKTHFTDRVVDSDFVIVNKKNVIRDLSKRDGEKNPRLWYRKQVAKHGMDYVTTLIYNELPKNTNVVLDAIHNPDEWNAIKRLESDAVLLYVVTPASIRDEREDAGDKEKNTVRLKYWHGSEKSDCLLSKADWSINGAEPIELQKQSFNYLKQYCIKNKIGYYKNGKRIN